MSTSDTLGADRLAREVARLVELGTIDPRSAAADALLDYLQVGGLDGPQSVPEWCEEYDTKRKAVERDDARRD